MRQKKQQNPAGPEKIVLDTRGVLLALRKSYHAPEHAFLTEVGNSTGFKCSRHADAVAMSLWPSRGLQITGFEIKASRSDWVRELENAGKADVMYGYCDLWYLAVGDERMVRDGELPPNWGLMVPRKDGFMFTKVLATVNKDLKPLDRGFVGAMLRRATEQLTEKGHLAAEFERGVVEGKEQANQQRRYDKFELEELQKKVHKFEKASGVAIANEWHTEEIGHAVRMVRHGMHLNLMEQLGRLEKTAREIADHVGVQMKMLLENQTKELDQNPPSE